MDPRDIENRLNTLLAYEPEVLVANHQQRFKNLVTKEHPPILFGAGRLGQIVLAGLRSAEIEPIAFADNDPRLWGTTVQGVEVLSLAEARQRSDQSAFVISIYTAMPVRKQLRQEGVREMTFPELAWLFPEQFLPHGAVEHPQKIIRQADAIRHAAQLWADDISQQEYLGQIAWRMSLDDSVLPSHLPQNEIYFPDMILPATAETFVDCGAFDGDSIREFIKRCPTFHAIAAIEPDQINFQALQAFIANLPAKQAARIFGFNNAVGAERGKVQFNETGSAASAIGIGSYSVDCIPLDELLNDTRPTYIKMDIEGAEVDALNGARKTIQTDLPALAICLYHKQEHLWEIPLLLRSFTDQYEFFLRRYSDHCWEIVCYAVPRKRLRK